jgi:hypothetical protein
LTGTNLGGRIGPVEPRGGLMKKALAIGVLMLSMVGLNALPASAHI